MSTGGLTLRQFKILLSVFYLKVVLVHRANVTKWLGSRWALFSKKHEEIALAQSDQKLSHSLFRHISISLKPNPTKQLSQFFCSGNQAKHGIQIIYLALLLAATWGWTCLWRMGPRRSWMCTRCHIWSHFAANAQMMLMAVEVAHYPSGLRRQFWEIINKQSKISQVYLPPPA